MRDLDPNPKWNTDARPLATASLKPRGSGTPGARDDVAALPASPSSNVSRG